MSSDEHPLPPHDEAPPRPQPDTGMVTWLLGVTCLVLWVLAGYFVITAQYLDGRAYAPADHALVTLLRVLAGACAIPAFVFALCFLNLRDQATMRSRSTAHDAAAQRASEQGL